MTKFLCSGDWHLEYADGELTPADLAEAKLHLAECPSCSREVAALRRSREMLTTYFSNAETSHSVSSVNLPTRASISWNSAALALASLAATALLVSVIFWRVGGSEKSATNIPPPSEPPAVTRTVADDPTEDEVLAMISRETQIARLRMASEILAKEPGMNERHEAIDRYLAEAYGVTTKRPFEM